MCCGLRFSQTTTSSPLKKPLGTSQTHEPVIIGIPGAGERTSTTRSSAPPLQESWDLYALYQDGVEWNPEHPDPADWFQNRQLEIGETYTQAKLEAAIMKLIEK